MICFNDMLSFGNFLNDTLKIEKNFSLTHKFEQTTGCLMYNATCSYTGEIAPKIQFALTADGQDTPFYESHLYRIGKKSEFTQGEAFERKCKFEEKNNYPFVCNDWNCYACFVNRRN